MQCININKTEAYSSKVTAFWANAQQKLINKAHPQFGFDYMFESVGAAFTFVLTQKLALELQGFLINHQQQCQQVSYMIGLFTLLCAHAGMNG